MPPGAAKVGQREGGIITASSALVAAGALAAPASAWMEEFNM